MTQKKSSHVFDMLFAFLLLIAFLLFSLLLSGVGSVIYQKGTDSLNENYTTRTALAYLQEKLRQHDETGAFTETTVGDQPALALTETKDDGTYITYIYYYEGALRELFTSVSVTLRMQEASSQSCPPLPLRSFLHHPKTTDICCVFQPRIMQVPHSPSSYILRAGADIVCNFFVCLTNFMRY